VKILGSRKLDFDDVLIRPKSSEAASRADVDLFRKFKEFPHSPRTLKCVPIIAANMDTTGSFEMANELTKKGWITCLHKHYGIDELVGYYDEIFGDLDPCKKAEIVEEKINHVWMSIGISDHDLNKLRVFISHTGFCPNLCVDVANGYTDHFVDKVAEIRSISPDSIIMAGNVATGEQVERLIRQGKADIVKVGIGPGSVCTTRIVTGVGYPQLSATIECADAAHGSQKGYICADGGCKYSGDVCKAFGAGADFVMLGSMLSGTDPCEGEWEYKEGTFEKSRLKYYGMSSYTAQDKYSGKSTYRPSEGKAVYVDYKGPVEDVCQQVEGGIRSCCTYIGAKKNKHMCKCTTFVMVNRTQNTFYENSNFTSTEESRNSIKSN